MNSRPTVMVVDDDSFDRTLIVSKLKAALDDCEIIELAESGRAVSECRDHSPDLVLLDIRMPSPDGFEVLDEMRRHHHESCGPIVMLSSSTDPADRRKAEELGASGYEIKPHSLGGYDEMVRALTLKYLQYPQRRDRQR